LPREIAAEPDTFCSTAMVSRWRFWFWLLVLAWSRGVCIWLIQWEPVLVRSIVQIVSTTPNILNAKKKKNIETLQLQDEFVLVN